MNMSERWLRDIFGQSFFKKKGVQKGIPFCTLKQNVTCSLDSQFQASRKVLLETIIIYPYSYIIR